MTKKHFIAIAATMREQIRLAGGPDATYVVEKVAIDLAATLAQFNPAFDRRRFLAACGVEG